ncbi:molecular chaperone DnaJ [uncultured Erythrobacter sp.]|uniref:molecular chaperone DnaJ n=1 Tax=uncultured Erythrobacter sp. TaxID=263913 RepID=UPI002634AE9D|nr:molecular chaperone DnaJ [uncultured Erythrobacter sp.]
MLKIAVLLIVITLLCRWAMGKWPWELLAGPPSRGQKLAEARKALGVDRSASREDILSAHKKIIAKVHPDRGGSTAEVHEANDARDFLLANLPPSVADAKHDDPPDGSSSD